MPEPTTPADTTPDTTPEVAPDTTTRETVQDATPQDVADVPPVDAEPAATADGAPADEPVPAAEDARVDSPAATAGDAPADEEPSPEVPAPAGAETAPALPGAPVPPAGFGPPAGVVPPAPRPAGTDGVAIAALVTGILWMGVIAIGLGIAGLVRTRRSGRGGRGLAIAGIVLGSVGVVGWFALIGLAVAAWNSDDFREGFQSGWEGAQADAGLVLEVGSCIQLPADLADVTNLVHVDCASPHSAEVVGARELTADVYPGETEVLTTADEFCFDVASGYVSPDVDTSNLDVGYLYPTSVSWQLGDRSIDCWVQTMDGTPLTGSVAQ
ncbi:septum formation family protein [Isoptericola sp. NEAU-Y5]|uniref:Septum formation family protein n=1 Tax=Isoptericola luteus TaxID=2879484 RepID=A0ABS7ZAG6_9MICO|nr:DUF4190 domain-containing protein [Isoptericola sp. NEAU-Y5]MCA5892046.1 septum formation family protein [Isoptericola sp. NEAU-Y5]